MTQFSKSFICLLSFCTCFPFWFNYSF